MMIPMLLVISFIVYYGLQLTGIDPINFMVSPEMLSSNHRYRHWYYFCRTSEWYHRLCRSCSGRFGTGRSSVPCWYYIDSDFLN